jgi:hypothetical protein
MREIPWTVEEIKEGLKTKDKWVYRAILAIFNLQTDQEQDSEATLDHNGIGFNSFDGHLLGSYAKQIQRWNNDKSVLRFPTPLSKKQTSIARNKIMKYSSQLVKIANGAIIIN